MLGHYITVALRNVLRHKWSSLLNVLCLALGMACFLIPYIIVYDIKGTDAHFAKSDRIRIITQSFTEVSGSNSIESLTTARPVSEYLKIELPELAAVVKSMPMWHEAVSYEGNTTYRPVRFVEREFLQLFDLPYIRGEFETALSNPGSAVLTKTAAESIFGTDDAIGKRFHLYGDYEVTVTSVIGEIPAPSHLSRSVINTDPVEAFISLDVWEKWIRAEYPERVRIIFELERWGENYYLTYVLLPEDGTVAVEELDSHLAGFGQRHVPASQGTAVFSSKSISEMTSSSLDLYLFNGELGISVTTVLLLLGCLVLLVACVNYINLATVQNIARKREIGIRKVIGAGRKEVIRQNLFETFLLCLAATVISVACVDLLTRIVNRETDFEIQGFGFLELEFWIIIFLLCLLVTLFSGVYSAMALARIRPALAIGKGGAMTGSGRLRVFLIGVQYFTASLLLIFSIVMYLQHAYLRQGALGTNPDPLLIVMPSLNYAGINPDTFTQRMQAHQNILELAGAAAPPWNDFVNARQFSHTPDRAASVYNVQVRLVGHEYFPTMDVPLLAGRYFSRDIASDFDPPENSDADTDFTVPHNIMIDEYAASLFGWDDPADAIGNTVFEYSNRRQAYTAQTIIGVVADAPFQLLSREYSRGIIYSYKPEYSDLSILRIFRENIPETLAYIDSTWTELAPNTPIFRRFMDEQFEEAYKIFDSIYKALIGLVIFAFIIASLGLFGMANFIARKRMHEIGIRKTLGARSRQIAALLLSDFFRPLLIANLIAWPFAYIAVQKYLTLFIDRMQLGILPFLLSLLITVAIALAAVGGQAFAASRTNPARILRYE